MTDEELAVIIEEYRLFVRSYGMGEVLTELATEKILRKKAEDSLAGYQSAPVHMAATVLKERLDEAEAEIARLKALFPACEFCGTEMPEGEQCQC